MIKSILSLNILLFSVLAFFNTKETQSEAIPMCGNIAVKSWVNPTFYAPIASAPTNSIPFKIDDSKAYSMPLLSKSPNGDVLLSWTEKDEKGVTAFCFSTSKDNGKTFSDKKIIYSGTGVSNSRLFRAKLLAKKNGDLVAVFANRPDAPPANAQQSPQAGASQGGGSRGRGGKGGALVYSESKDGGTTWTSLQAVDTDPSQGMRGFFDAIVLPNDEIAVAYLKDVKNSTKHEERDLRLAITKNGVFQAEKLLDAVVCDCCNINMLIDANGALNVIYRDNNDDIRDFSKMVSTDNGTTFSKPQTIYNDGWKIAGCPHNGAFSSVHGKSALMGWYSGAETESGFRVVNQEGKKLFVLSDPSVKNPALMGSAQVSAMIWEQGRDKTQLVFKKIIGENVSETLSINGSDDATNATGLVVGNQLLIAHEVKQSNSKNSLKIATTAL